MAAATDPAVDTYIAAFPAKMQRVLKRVRSTIRKAAPAAEERFAYQMPAYRLAGRPLVYFGGWAHHYALYGASGTLVEEMADELAGYTVSKGTIQFSYDDPVPVALIARIVQRRAEENLARQSSKASKSKKPAK